MSLKHNKWVAQISEFGMQPGALTFGLDFDDTFTADPSLWAAFCDAAFHRGHHVILVTARRDTDENRETINEAMQAVKLKLPIIFAALGSKLHAVEKRGTKVSIWIDDDPTKLVHGH